MTTIETKFAKNGSLICKINGKREKRENVEEAIRNANMYDGNVEFKNEFGSVYTSEFNGDIYRFADQYGNKETFVYADDVVYKLARVHFDAPATAPVEVKAEAAPVDIETANVEETAEAKAVEETANAEESVEKINNILNAYETESGNAATGAGYKVVAYYGAETALPDTVCRTYATMEAAKAAAEYLTDAGAILYYGISDNRPIIDINAGVFAASVIAPAKMLALPAPAEVKAGAEPKAETPTIKADLVIVEESDADYKRTVEIVELYKRRDAAKAFLAETVDFYKGALELGDTETFKALGKERSEHHKTIIACTKRLRELGAIPETKITCKPEVYDDNPDDDSPEPTPVNPTAEPKPPIDDEWVDVTEDAPPVEDTQDHWVDTVEETADEPYQFTEQDGKDLARNLDIICQDAIDAINANAPAGWAVTCQVNVTVNDDKTDYTIEKRHWVTYNGKFVEEILPVTCDDVKRADNFFDRFRNSPCALAAGLNQVFQSVVRGISYMDVTTQDGAKIATTFGAAYIEPDWRAADGYVIANSVDTFARYETAEQVIDVMTALRDTINRGETTFTFHAEPKAEPTPPPVDDFTAKLAELDADLARTSDERGAAKAAYDKACDAAHAAVYARQAFLDRYAVDLSRKFATLPEQRDYISIVKPDGTELAAVDFRKMHVEAVNSCDKVFAFKAGVYKPFAYYDTPAQAEAVINAIKESITAGVTVFTFPTVAKLNALTAATVDNPPHEPEPAPETVAAVARICATVNAAAPRGWGVYYDVPAKLFTVEFNDKPVARLTPVEFFDTWDAHPPENFFDIYAPCVSVEYDDQGNITDIWF